MKGHRASNDAARKAMAELLARSPEPNDIITISELLEMGGAPAKPTYGTATQFESWQQFCWRFTSELHIQAGRAARTLVSLNGGRYRLSAPSEVVPMEEARVYTVLDRAVDRFDWKASHVRKSGKLDAEDRAAASDACARVGNLAAAMTRAKEDAEKDANWRNEK